MEELLKYGINSDLAHIANSIGLNVTNIRATSKKLLIKNYGLTEQQAKVLKDNIVRKPISEADVQLLLERNAGTCCVCQGKKSDAYIIHHIEHYNISQNNEYDNLVLLCPNDHELAHREGESLANKITPKQLISFKKSWEKNVEENKVRKATLKGEIHDVDYLNVHRILELANQFDDVTNTKYYLSLLVQGLIQKDNSLNPKFYTKNKLNPNTPLKFFAGFGSHTLIQHYFDILLNIFERVEVHDLDYLLKKSEIKKGIIGKFCYYVGGVYGKQYRGIINEESEYTSIHFRRKPFIVEWSVNPMFITSSTASWRIARRPIYAIYGKIVNVSEVTENGVDFIHIEIRPYVFGIALTMKNRTPIIHYIKNIDRYSFDEDDK